MINLLALGIGVLIGAWILVGLLVLIAVALFTPRR
jgi:hypothetical protein